MRDGMRHYINPDELDVLRRFVDSWEDLSNGDHKVLASRDFSTVELYNLRADPAEAENLAAKDATRLASMRDKLKSLNGEIEAEGPDWWKRLSPDGGGPLKK